MQGQAHDKIGFVFLNGAGLESRIWNKVVKGFDHPYLLIESPHRKSPFELRKQFSLADYVTHIKRQIDEWGVSKFVIVAHSLGGIFALKLASELTGQLAGLVAIGAAIPKNGGSFLSVLPFPKRILLSAILRTMGTKPPESAIRTGLCNDLAPDQTAEIIRDFTPEAVRVYTDRVDASCPMVPKLYVKLTEDKEFNLSLQDKMISNFDPQFVRVLNTGHLPMLSDPDGLRSVLQDFFANLKGLDQPERPAVEWL